MIVCSFVFLSQPPLDPGLYHMHAWLQHRYHTQTHHPPRGEEWNKLRDVCFASSIWKHVWVAKREKRQDPAAGVKNKQKLYGGEESCWELYRQLRDADPLAQRSQCCLCAIEWGRQRRSKSVWNVSENFASPEQTFQLRKPQDIININGRCHAIRICSECADVNKIHNLWHC